MSKPERIKQIKHQIYSMECAYDDLMTNYKDEYEDLQRELQELQNKTTTQGEIL